MFLLKLLKNDVECYVWKGSSIYDFDLFTHQFVETYPVSVDNIIETQVNETFYLQP